MEMDLLTRFMFLQLTKNDKTKNLKRYLNDIVATKRDCIVIKKDFDHSEALVLGGNGVVNLHKDFVLVEEVEKNKYILHTF